jgi:hypothetical protein
VVHSAKIRFAWEEFRNRCVEILGVESRRGGLETETARDPTMRKAFSFGATIAAQGYELLVHYFVKHKSDCGRNRLIAVI